MTTFFLFVFARLKIYIIFVRQMDESQVVSGCVGWWRFECYTERANGIICLYIRFVCVRAVGPGESWARLCSTTDPVHVEAHSRYDVTGSALVRLSLERIVTRVSFLIADYRKKHFNCLKHEVRLNSTYKIQRYWLLKQMVYV